MKPLRVAVVVQRFWPRVGAMETRAAHAARELAGRGVEVTVATARWRMDWPAEIHFHGIPVVRIAPAPTGRWTSWRRARALTRWLRRHGEQFDAALVWGLLDEAQAAITALAPRVPVVLVPERTGWRGDCFRQVRASRAKSLHKACRRAAALVAFDPAVRRELEAAGYSRERIRDVPPGVPLQSPRSQETRAAAREQLADASPGLALDARAPLVVSTTRLAAERGWETLLDAWARVARRKPGARLWLAGEAPHDLAARERIHRLGIAGSASLIGKFDDVSPLLAAADIHAAPAPDGSPQPILEAMAAGLPSVAADVPVNRWLLGDDEAGLLVPAGDAESLARAIVRILDDPNEALRLDAGWRRAQQEFSMARMGDALHAVLQEAADNERENATP